MGKEKPRQERTHPRVAFDNAKVRGCITFCTDTKGNTNSNHLIISILKIYLYKAVYHQRPVETFMEPRMKEKKKEKEKRKRKKEKEKENMAHYDVKSNSG